MIISKAIINLLKRIQVTFTAKALSVSAKDEKKKPVYLRMLFLTHTYSTIEYYKIFNIGIYENQNIRLHECS